MHTGPDRSASGSTSAPSATHTPGDTSKPSISVSSPPGCFCESLGLHDVDPGVDRVGKYLAPGGLLQEPLDPAILPDDNDAEFQRIRYPGQAHPDQRRDLSPGR